MVNFESIVLEATCDADWARQLEYWSAAVGGRLVRTVTKVIGEQNPHLSDGVAFPERGKPLFLRSGPHDRDKRGAGGVRARGASPHPELGPE